MKSENFSDRTFRDFPAEKKCLDPEDVPFLGSLPETLRAFRRVAGFELRFVRAGASENDADELCERIPIGEPGTKIFGSLFLSRVDDGTAADWESARALARALAATIAENYRWRAETVAREAELAALAVRGESEIGVLETPAKTAVKLRDVLRTGAKALGGFNAAALYLLDEATTSLKLRAVWGLPNDRFLEPPRPLRGSRADVEALLGSAVVLNEAYLAEAWKAPEDFECSICVPVASETTILGTMWYFSNRKREIETRELDALELVAGRIVAELEKETLKQENAALRDESAARR